MRVASRVGKYRGRTIDRGARRRKHIYLTLEKNKPNKMSKLDDEIRLNFERFIDRILENPTIEEEKAREILIEMGIEPNLEIVLSFIIGYGLASAVWHSARKFREPRNQDIRGIRELFKRRAWEIRETFIKTRIKE